MPFLGGSQREWTEVVGNLSRDHRCITIDLPGFGAAAQVSGYSVSSMADALAETVRLLDLRRYVFVGHSMAAKIMAVTARQLIPGGVAAPPQALILVAPSPPGPEPMSDEKRSEMLASLGSESQRCRGRYLERDHPAAEKFIHQNVARPIADRSFARTVDEVLAINPEAWVAWLECGSKEDWGAFVGILDIPTLIVAGAKDEALGPSAQRKHALPHFENAELKELDCSHLIPLERPEETATLITEFLATLRAGAIS